MDRKDPPRRAVVGLARLDSQPLHHTIAAVVKEGSSKKKKREERCQVGCIETESQNR